MIDTSKQYTYNGRPVRIYADGSDTTYKKLHCGVGNNIGEWDIATCWESDLVEAWQPKEGELVWCWDDGATLPSLRKYDKCRAIWNHYAPFTGNLPEAFKGLV